jgi:hypothetical protein
MPEVLKENDVIKCAIDYHIVSSFDFYCRHELTEILKQLHNNSFVHRHLKRSSNSFIL